MTNWVTKNNITVSIDNKPNSFKLNLNFLAIILEPDAEEIWIIMNFSEREGHKKPKHNPLESMDADLKNAI